MAFVRSFLVFVLVAGTGVGVEGAWQDHIDNGGPVAEALTMECESDEDCKEDEFCFGRGKVKRCQECLDCKKLMRKPRMMRYSGIAGCAKRPTDCGECYPGFVEAPGACVSEYLYAQYATPTPAPSFHRQEDNKKEEGLEANIGTIVGVVGAIAITVCVVAGMYSRWNSGRGESGERGGSTCKEDEEIAGLTNEFESPSAPPSSEYEQQPPVYLGGGRLLSQLPEPIMHREEPTRSRAFSRGGRAHGAMPIGRGNGAGPWHVVNENAGQNGDGGGGVRGGDEDMDVDAVDGAGDDEAVVPGARNSTPANSAQASQPQPSSSHGASDPIVATVNARVQVNLPSVPISIYNMFNPLNIITGHQYGIANSASAPPRFAPSPSIASMDSGNGSHNRSGQSNFASESDLQDFSDPDFSMFDESPQASPISQPLAPQQDVAPVPDFAQQLELGERLQLDLGNLIGEPVEYLHNPMDDEPEE